MAEPADAVEGGAERRSDPSPAAGRAPSDPRRIDWDEVRRLYEAGEMQVLAIRAAFGLTEKQLRWRREREGWPPRRSVDVRCTSYVAPAATPDEIGQSLAALIGIEIERLKRRLARKRLDQTDARLLAELAK